MLRCSTHVKYRLVVQLLQKLVMRWELSGGIRTYPTQLLANIWETKLKQVSFAGATRQ